MQWISLYCRTSLPKTGNLFYLVSLYIIEETHLATLGSARKRSRHDDLIQLSFIEALVIHDTKKDAGLQTIRWKRRLHVRYSI